MRERAAGRDGHPGTGLSAMVALLAVILAPLVGLLPSGAAAQEWSPPRTVFVPSTGHTVDGLFLDVWRARPDLLGDPITEEFDQAGLDVAVRGTPTPEEAAEYVVQYFENLAIAYVPENEPGEQVVMLDLGREAAKDLESTDRSAFEAADGCGGLPGAECVNFPVQDHSLRWGFKDFWEEHDGQRMLGSPISEEFRDEDGSTVQYFEHAALRWKADEDVALLPLGRDLAKRLKLTTKAIERPAEIPTFDEAIFVAPEPEPEREPAGPSIGSGAFGPGPQQGGYKEIVISISAQSLWAYEDGQLVISTLVSTGTAESWEVTTPIGYWSVLAKYDSQTMEGTISNEYYRVEDVPHVMYFDNLGNAIHGAYWHNNFGAPMSHGCVNLPLDVAAFLYGWTPMGTGVTVVG